MDTWLDTETKALLEKPPPKKFAPPDTATFSLVLLSQFRHDIEREIRAVRRILRVTTVEARHVLGKALPACITKGLTHNEAILGQFELICCDAVSVFIEDDVMMGASQEYLGKVYEQLLKSDEFSEVRVRIESLPPDEHGDKFVDQFLGADFSQYPADFTALRKKARIMHHWATMIGGVCSLIQE